MASENKKSLAADVLSYDVQRYLYAPVIVAKVQHAAQSRRELLLAAAVLPDIFAPVDP